MLIQNCLLIDGAEIFEKKKDIRILDGKIFQVENCLTPEDVEEIIDAGGAVVTPGFVEGNCQLGITSQVHRFEEADANDARPVMPEMRAYDALNFADEGFEMAVSGGVTCAVTGPGNENLIGGTCAAVKTAGDHLEKRIVEPEIAYRFVFTNAPRKKFGAKGKSPETRMASAAMIREALFQAQEYHRKEKAGEKQEYRMELAALARVFDGMPVQMVAMKANDMEAAVRIGEEFGLNYILVMAYDALTVCEDLQRKDFKFIIGPLYGLSFSAEAAGKDLALGARMEKAGLHPAIATGHPSISEDLIRMQLALMVDRGLGREEAIKGVTAYPAKYYGLDSRIGTLEPGKDADLVIWNGDPISYSGSVGTMLIDGKKVFP